MPPELFTHTLASSLLEPFLQPARDTVLLPAGNRPRLQRERRAATPTSAELKELPSWPHRLGPDSGGSVLSLQGNNPRREQIWLYLHEESHTDRGAEPASATLGAPPPSVPAPYLEFRSKEG